jgi:hypothetical protein
MIRVSEWISDYTEKQQQLQQVLQASDLELPRHSPPTVCGLRCVAAIKHV